MLCVNLMCEFASKEFLAVTSGVSVLCSIARARVHPSLVVPCLNAS